MQVRTGPDRGRRARASVASSWVRVVAVASLAAATSHAGMDGLSKVPDAPHIAGQIEGYLVTQLHAIKSGARKSEAMTVVASSLSDQDIENVSAYFAAIDLKVGKLPGD
jgi:cytochrome c553